ncbi:phage head-tail connector protein [Paenibacillus sp. GYB004]|uniref:phage head-tail connector protein n=1 Tax=Paenibacillus sp. GYB004 TaxID=2994393 RepID=UPI002F961878
MAISKAEIRDLVKRRLGIALTDTTHDDLIDLYIDATEEAILNYCNISSVPDGLKQTWAAMAAGALSAEQSAILYPNPDPVEVYETHIGDTTVKPVKQVAPPVPSLTVIESLVFDYRPSLHAYRRLRW